MVMLLSVFGGNLVHFCAGALILCLVTGTEGCPGGADEMKALHKKLLDDYNPVVRPSRNYSKHTDVSIQLYVSAIMGLDTKKQLLFIRAFSRITWIDEYLQWEPKDHGCIKRIVVMQNSIWKPDIILYNTANENDNLGSERTYISVNSYGLAKWEPPFYLEGTCKMDMTKYPFDVSICPIVISSWMTDNQSTVMRWPDEPVNFQNMMINGEYELSSGGAMKEINTFEDQFFEMITFKIRLSRRPLYIVVSLLVPVNLLAILGILSFIVPPKEPEKVAISMTIMLSFTVFLTLIDSNIPPTFDNISLLVLYISAHLVLSFVSVVGNIVVVTVKTRDKIDSDNVHSSRIENSPKQHSIEAISCKNEPHEHTKSSQDLLETDNCGSSRIQIYVTGETKEKRQISNTRAARLNTIFMILSCVAFGLISCTTLVLVIL